MANRKSVPVAAETELLTASARRCCVCFGLKGDFEIKQGQIVHLDHDPSNAAADNLAWMCFDHHDQYDSKTSQSKGMKIEEVKRYRDTLHTAVAERLPGRQRDLPTQRESVSRELITTHVLQLITKIQSRSSSLAACITEALALAQEQANASLEQFCRNEIGGYFDNESAAPSYRVIEGFASYKARINPNFFGWGDNTSAVFDYMRQHEDFHLKRLAVLNSVSEIESKASLGSRALLAEVTVKASDFDPMTNMPDYPVVVYTRPDVYGHILELTRQDLIQRLMAVLP